MWHARGGVQGGRTLTRDIARGGNSSSTSKRSHGACRRRTHRPCRAQPERATEGYCSAQPCGVSRIVVGAKSQHARRTSGGGRSCPAPYSRAREYGPPSPGGLMCPPAVVRVGAGASAGNRARGGTALPTLAGGYIYAAVDPSGATASVYRSCACWGQRRCEHSSLRRRCYLDPGGQTLRDGRIDRRWACVDLAALGARAAHAGVLSGRAPWASRFVRLGLTAPSASIIADRGQSWRESREQKNNAAGIQNNGTTATRTTGPPHSNKHY